MLDADTVEWFKQHGGLKRENGDRFRAMLLSRGGSADALGLFKNFVGRDPYIEPLLKRRGLDRGPGAEDTKTESPRQSSATSESRRRVGACRASHSKATLG